MMIAENRYLAVKATLNKHRKQPSETFTGEPPILANHALVDHLHLLP